MPLLRSSRSFLDRDALLLRFFKNEGFRTVGLALGLSADAAQKRVSRALEKLRRLLARRGITTGASALAATISANAVQAAPQWLNTTVSAASITATVKSAALAIPKAIAMTTLQKTVIGTTLAVVIGAGIHEVHHVSRLTRQVQALQQQNSALAAQVGQLTTDRDTAQSQVADLKERLRVQNSPAATQSPAELSSDPTDAAVQSWLARIHLLKQRLAQTPRANIPELRFLKALDWAEVAANTKLQTEIDFHKALAELRKRGEDYFTKRLGAALRKYMAANAGQRPDEISELAPYLDPPVDSAMLDRWEIVPKYAFAGQQFASDQIITEKAAVDPEFDSRHTIDGPWSGGVGPWRPYGEQQPSKEEKQQHALLATLAPVIHAYRLANGGGSPTDPSQLQPYISNPAQQAALQRVSAMLSQQH